MSLDLLLDQPGRIFVLDEVDSTNDEARRWLLQERDFCPDPPFAIIARRQLAGRGRGSNAWYSDEGSHIETIVFDPRSHGLGIEHEPRLALAFACCLIRRIEARVGTRLAENALGIRWPNDLEANGLKWGGLLPESVETPDGPRLLFGIGLNVTTNLDHAPRDVRQRATTLAALAGGPASGCWRTFLRDSTAKALGEAVSRLAAADPALPEEWACLDTLRGLSVAVFLPGRVVRGTGAGIDSNGRLLVATASGIEPLTSGVLLR